MRTDDAARLTEIARAAKAHWNYPDEWLIEWRDILTVTAADIERATMYKAVADIAVLGFYSLRAEPDALELDHMWVSPDAIGRGVGRLLLTHAMETARTLDATRIMVESDPNAVGFYERMGGVRVGVAHHPVAGTPRQLPILELPI